MSDHADLSCPHCCGMQWIVTVDANKILRRDGIDYIMPDAVLTFTCFKCGEEYRNIPEKNRDT